MTTIAAALTDLLFTPDLPVAQAADRHFTADYRQRIDGKWDDRAGFLAHITHLRDVVAVGVVEVHEELRNGSLYADRHTVTITKADGSTVRMEVYLFGEQAADGRFRRIEETTLLLDGDEADRDLGSARLPAARRPAIPPRRRSRRRDRRAGQCVHVCQRGDHVFHTVTIFASPLMITVRPLPVTFQVRASACHVPATPLVMRPAISALLTPRSRIRCSACAVYPATCCGRFTFEMPEVGRAACVAGVARDAATDGAADGPGEWPDGVARAKTRQIARIPAKTPATTTLRLRACTERIIHQLGCVGVSGKATAVA